MNIDAINDGIVIDHITSGRGIKLYEMLKKDLLQIPVAVIQNVSSKKMGKKDIIKIGQRINIDFDVVGFVTPDATVSIIEDGGIKEKFSAKMPQKVTDVIKCKNPRCITSTEQELKHIFVLTDEQKGEYRCIYCESKA